MKYFTFGTVQVLGNIRSIIWNNGIYFLFVLVLFIISRIIGFDGAYGQDAYEYLRFSENLTGFAFHGDNLTTFSWPLGYPFFVALINIIIHDVFVSGQLVSLVALAGISVFSKKTINLLYPENNVSGYYSMIFILASPYMVRLGLSAMSDMLAALFVVLTFYSFFKFKKKQEAQFLLLTIAFGALSLITRNGAITLIFIPCLLGIIELFKLKKWTTIALAGFLSFLIMFPSYLIGNSQIKGVNYSMTESFSFSHLFSSNFNHSFDGIHNELMPNIVYILYPFFHPAFLFVGGLLLVILFIKKLSVKKILLYSILLYLIMIGMLYYQNKRFFIISFPLITIFLFPAFHFIKSKFTSKSFSFIIMIGCFLVNTGLAIYTTKKAYELQQFDKHIANKLESYQNNRIYTFDLDVAIKGRGLVFDYQNLWENEITDFQVDAYVLFNEDKFKVQWKDHFVMQNWKRLSKNYQLNKIKDLGMGWELYQIKSSL